MTFGERDAAVGSLAAPVFGHNHVLAGALAVTGPIVRFTESYAARRVPALRHAAARLTMELGGNVRVVRQLQKR
jgi:DNA-binding IclR family transcriptional regulator